VSVELDRVKATYHHKDLRNGLIAEVFAMLETQGHADLTLRDLARRLGVTHTAPYAHFADKTELLIAVADAGFGRLAQRLAAARDAEAEPVRAFHAIGLTYVRFAREHPNLYRLMFADPDTADGGERELCEEGERAFGIVAEVIASVGTPPELVGDTAVSAWAFVHGVAMLDIDRRISGKTMRSGDDIFTLGAQLLVRGLTVPG
jgi:AcrR family transcriptional regulator